MKTPFKLYLVFGSLFILLLTKDSFSQTGSQIRNTHYQSIWAKKRKFQFRYSSFGISINGFNYFGDLAPSSGILSTEISLTRVGFGLSYFRRQGPRFHYGIQYLFGSIEGSDSYSNDNFRRQRNLSFKNTIHEINFIFVIDLFDNWKSYRSRELVNPYLFAGLSFYYHNPKAKIPARSLSGSMNVNAGDWVDLQPLGTEGQFSNLLPTDANYGITPYSLFQIAIPIGIGTRFKLNEKMDIWFDIGLRYSFTDYLDDVSKNYVDLNRLNSKDKENSDIARSLSYRSNEIPKLVGNKINTYVLNDRSISIIDGYGSEYITNKRGEDKGNDVYLVTSLKFTHIINPISKRPKYR